MYQKKDECIQKFLEAICREFGCTMDELRKANGGKLKWRKGHTSDLSEPSD